MKRDSFEFMEMLFDALQEIVLDQNTRIIALEADLESRHEWEHLVSKRLDALEPRRKKKKDEPSVNLGTLYDVMDWIESKGWPVEDKSMMITELVGLLRTRP